MPEEGRSFAMQVSAIMQAKLGEQLQALHWNCVAKRRQYLRVAPWLQGARLTLAITAIRNQNKATDLAIRRNWGHSSQSGDMLRWFGFVFPRKIKKARHTLKRDTKTFHTARLGFGIDLSVGGRRGRWRHKQPKLDIVVFLLCISRELKSLSVSV